MFTAMVIGKCTDIFRGIFLAWVWGSGEGAIWEDLSLEEYFTGEEKFNEWAQGLLALLLKKNNENIKMKKFSHLKVRRSIKT